MFPIIGALEALAGETACAKATDEDVRRIRVMHDEMVECYRNGDSVAYIKLNRDIDNALFEIAGNPALSSIYQALMIRTHSVLYVAKKSPERWREAVEDHQRMTVALETRDGSLLAHMLRVNLRHKADTVRESMEDLSKFPLLKNRQTGHVISLKHATTTIATLEFNCGSLPDQPAEVDAGGNQRTRCSSIRRVQGHCANAAHRVPSA